MEDLWYLVDFYSDLFVPLLSFEVTDKNGGIASAVTAIIGIFVG